MPLRVSGVRFQPFVLELECAPAPLLEVHCTQKMLWSAASVQLIV